jgi:hypothetical protein
MKLELYTSELEFTVQKNGKWLLVNTSVPGNIERNSFEFSDEKLLRKLQKSLVNTLVRVSNAYFPGKVNKVSVQLIDKYSNRTELYWEVAVILCKRQGINEVYFYNYSDSVLVAKTMYGYKQFVPAFIPKTRTIISD